MTKGKPRHNPDKPQNNYGRCPYYDGKQCEAGIKYGNRNPIKICKGNRHNCVKVEYKVHAIYNSSRRLINENP